MRRRKAGLADLLVLRSTTETSGSGRGSVVGANDWPPMSTIDWSIVAAYLVIAVLVGLRFARRASKNPEEFFLAGRSLPWFIAGTSMVATTFSSDTPLWMAGAVREEGVSAAWILWANIFGTLATVFYFARLWRRSKALTEVEFVIQRYDAGPVTHALRVFKAVFDGVFVNCIIMASVTLAMSKILTVVLGLSSEPLVVVPLVGGITPNMMILVMLGLAAVLYTMLSGLYGVVYTDLVQFGLAMIGAFALAIIVFVDLESDVGMLERLREVPRFESALLNIFPEFGFNLPTATFLILLTVGWLFLAPGTGFYLQRVLATRSEKDAMLSVYWYCFCNYILRSWPWIVVGIASIVYFPVLADSESAYPEMLNALLPIGLKGIMVASLLAAFMSTLDTHLNWGASYLVNDIYKPYLKSGLDQKHYVRAGRIAMGALIIVALLVATRLTGLLDAYKYLAVFWAGLSFVLIARWYWWRINAWSEVASLICAALFGNALFVLLPDRVGQDWFAVRMLMNFLVTASVCIVVTCFFSKKEPSGQTVNFYRKIRLHGVGWKRVRTLTGVRPVAANLAESTLGFVASSLFFFGTLMAMGYAIFQQWWPATASAVVCFLSGSYLVRTKDKLIQKLNADDEA